MVRLQTILYGRFCKGTFSEHESENMGLSSINKYLEQHGKMLADYHLPNVALPLTMEDTYDCAYEAERAVELISTYVEYQKRTLCHQTTCLYL